jgi:hypothetical protein
MDRMGVYNDEENLEIDLNNGLPSEEDSLDDYTDPDYGDGMHDRENEDPEVYMPSSKWQYESVELTGVVTEVLNEHVDVAEARGRAGSKIPANYAQLKARRLAAIKKAAKKAAKVAPPVDDVEDEDEFAAPERIVDVGDKEDYEDYNKSNDIDFNEIGVDIEDFNDRDDFGGWR